MVKHLRTEDRVYVIVVRDIHRVGSQAKKPGVFNLAQYVARIAESAKKPSKTTNHKSY